jgi:hypothetical protein
MCEAVHTIVAFLRETVSLSMGDVMNLNSVREGKGQNPLDYEVDITHPQIPGDIAYGAMTFFRNKNPNGLSPTLHNDDSGPWLKLAVAPETLI